MSRAGFGEAEPWIIRRRNLSATDVASRGELVEQNRSLSRLGLALALCELWQWRSANGLWKTHSALTNLEELERRERLRLPALRNRGSHSRVRPRVTAGADLPLPPLLQEPLAHDRPLGWVRVTTAEQHRHWNELIDLMEPVIGRPIWNFPHLRSDLNDTLDLVRSHQLRNDCAYRCHRQRRLAELATWATLAPQPPG